MHFSRSNELSEMCVRMCKGARTRLGIETTIEKGTDGDGEGAEDGDNQVLSSGKGGVSAVARQFLIEFTLRMRRHCDSGRGGMQHERYECGQNGDECHSPAHSENN